MNTASLLCLILSLFLFSFTKLNAYEANLNCISGPSYWCKSIQNAKECGAFKHCTQTVWTKHEKYLKLDNTVVVDTATPNKCTNCIQCLSTDLRRCAYVNLYKEEISELLLINKLSSKAICSLLRQCDLPDQQEHQLVEQEQLVEHTDESKSTVDDFLIANDMRFKCGMHPRNWCDSLKVTRRCHAFDYCLAGWSKSTVKYTSKPITSQDASLMAKEELSSQKACGFCIFVFNKLQSVIQQNATQVEVKEYLEGACSLLPSQSEVNDCLNLINTYYTEIYNMVRNNIDPGIICRVLRACKDKFLIPVETSTTSTTSSSNEMEKFLASLKQAKFKVLNENEAIIKTPLQQKSLLTQLGTRSHNLIPQLQKTWGVGCEVCTIVLNAAKYLLENKVEDKKILNFIETQLCARLGEYNTTCWAYVSEEGEIVLDLIAKSVDPAVICRGMGLCLKVQVSDEFINEPFFDLQVRNPLNCTLCKLVITQVKQMLTDNKKQAEILQYIDTNLCAKVGKTKEICKSLIDAYGPLFLEIIARDVNPTQLCTMLGMCEKSAATQINSIGYIDLEESRPVVPSRDAQYVEPSSSQTCVLCEFVLNVLSRYISQNSTEPEIEKWLGHVCTVFPSSLKGECNSFVKEYGPIIVTLLVKLQPDQICTAINLCPKKQSHLDQMFSNLRPKTLEFTTVQEVVEVNEKHKDHDLECTVCEFSIEYLYHQYNIEQTEKNIEFALNNVCKITPASYRSFCETMVNKYGPSLIDFMKKYSNSYTVCKQIKMCKTSSSNSKQQRDTQMNNNNNLIDLMPAQVIKQRKVFFDSDTNVKNGSIECSLCMYAAQLVVAKLKENKTEEQIVSELEIICNLFPKTLKDQCVSFIDEYGPYICQLVAQDLDPQTTCSSLKLCDATIPEETLKRLYDNFHH